MPNYHGPIDTVECPNADCVNGRIYMANTLGYRITVECDTCNGTGYIVPEPPDLEDKMDKGDDYDNG